MALWHCCACGAAYSVGAPRCPQCRSTDYEEDSVPKISKAGATGAEPEAARAAAEDVPGFRLPGPGDPGSGGTAAPDAAGTAPEPAPKPAPAAAKPPVKPPKAAAGD